MPSLDVWCPHRTANVAAADKTRGLRGAGVSVHYSAVVDVLKRHNRRPNDDGDEKPESKRTCCSSVASRGTGGIRPVPLNGVCGAGHALRHPPKSATTPVQWHCLGGASVATFSDPVPSPEAGKVAHPEK